MKGQSSTRVRVCLGVSVQSLVEPGTLAGVCNLPGADATLRGPAGGPAGLEPAVGPASLCPHRSGGCGAPRADASGQTQPPCHSKKALGSSKKCPALRKQTMTKSRAVRCPPEAEGSVLSAAGFPRLGPEGSSSPGQCLAGGWAVGFLAETESGGHYLAFVIISTTVTRANASPQDAVRDLLLPRGQCTAWLPEQMLR